MSIPGSTKTHNPTMVEKLYKRGRGPRGKEGRDFQDILSNIFLKSQN
jgi:hypothetical protein